MYAIIETCGKQYKVEEKDIVFFEKLDIAEGKKVVFDKVILISENTKIQVGSPYLKDVKVEGKVIKHGKGKKIIVFKMKSKKNERKKQGHRQPYTKVEITSIKTTIAKPKEEKKAEIPKKETKSIEKPKKEIKNMEKVAKTTKATTTKEL